MTIITLATVKAQLGITVGTYDSEISTQIPIIDAKVKQICNDSFNRQMSIDTISGSPYAELLLDSDLVKDITVGTLLSGDSIPDTSVLEVYYDHSAEFGGITYSAPFVKMADNATASGTVMQTYYGWNHAYDSVIAKGIWYLISQTSTSISDDTWTSKRYGPVSVTRGGKIDMASGMPMWFIKALPRYH